MYLRYLGISELEMFFDKAVSVILNLIKKLRIE